MNVEILPVRGVPDVRPGDDLGALLSEALGILGLRDGDVVAVTQKVVSKAEGRVVAEDGPGRSRWVERESVRIVARRGDLVISQTRHGFVCANAGVDASNVERGLLTLLPEDPDASAEALRTSFAARLGVDVAVVVTDTFGRAWRRGVVNVAIGCSGLPALVDLRGTLDHTGRPLEATVVALADEIAAASGLVMGKAARVPAALLRGIDAPASASPARELIRPPEEDLFRESPLLALSEDAPGGAPGPGEVPPGVLEEAVRAAMAAPGPGPAPRRLLVAATSSAARRRLLGALQGDAAGIERAALLLAAFARAADDAERELAIAAGGAAVQSLRLALRAQGFASRWSPAHGDRHDDVRAALEVDDEWIPLGVVAAGPASAGAAPPRPPLDLSDLLRSR